jgi:hypothetical protein
LLGGELAGRGVFVPDKAMGPVLLGKSLGLALGEERQLLLEEKLGNSLGLALGEEN